jgi:hypothetical protein
MWRLQKHEQTKILHPMRWAFESDEDGNRQIFGRLRTSQRHAGVQGASKEEIEISGRLIPYGALPQRF